MSKVVMTEKDLEESVYDGVWHPRCPNCDELTPAEPDVTYTICIHCDSRIEIENPFE